jgi:hypothetical protein
MGDNDTYTRFEMVQEPGANMKDQASIQTSECGGSFDTCCFSRKGSCASMFHGGAFAQVWEGAIETAFAQDEFTDSIR